MPAIFFVRHPSPIIHFSRRRCCCFVASLLSLPHPLLRSPPLAAAILKSPGHIAAVHAMSSWHDKEKAVNVQVLRCRLFNDDELWSNVPQVITCNSYQREVENINRGFTFDKISSAYSLSFAASSPSPEPRTADNQTHLHQAHPAARRQGSPVTQCPPARTVSPTPRPAAACHAHQPGALHACAGDARP